DSAGAVSARPARRRSRRAAQPGSSAARARRRARRTTRSGAGASASPPALRGKRPNRGLIRLAQDSGGIGAPVGKLLGRGIGEAQDGRREDREGGAAAR